MWQIAFVLSSIFVVDGDTIYNDGMKIRLWGINAPEMSTVAGRKAKNGLMSLIKDSNLTCNQIDTDHYGRLVSQCFLEDGRDLACVMVENGWANDWPLFSGGYYEECE